MVKLSNKTILGLKADISSILYENPLVAKFTSEIAQELRRDEEFVKKLLLEMEKEGLIKSITKNNKGKDYLLRKRWVIPKKVLDIYNINKLDQL